MLIDWFTVAAQAINFLLLIFVLQRFLYKPLRRAMDERKKRIADDLEQAETARDEAKRQRRELREERENLDEERRQVLEKARQEAEQWREQAMDKARTEVDEQRRQWRRALHEEREAFARELTTRIAEAAFTVCRKALDDLADATLQERLAEKMLELLPQNGGPRPQRVTVRTGFAADEDVQQRLREALTKHWPSLKEVAFEQQHDLGFGMECHFDGDKVAWNASRYMGGLEERVMASFARLPESSESPESPESPESGENDNAPTRSETSDAS